MGGACNLLNKFECSLLPKADFPIAKDAIGNKPPNLKAFTSRHS
jgi:hypothetical protein